MDIVPPQTAPQKETGRSPHYAGKTVVPTLFKVFARVTNDQERLHPGGK
jgi:hypothetical protein